PGRGRAAGHRQRLRQPHRRRPEAGAPARGRIVVLALAVTVAIVVQPGPLVASADENPARQAQLAPGEWLEVRGALRGRPEGYDPRRERPGYVLPAQVRTYPLDGSAAPALHAIIDFLRDQPGSESLGIGYVALYLKVAPAAAIGPDTFDALGTMAERLA